MPATPEEVLQKLTPSPHWESLSARALGVVRAAFASRQPEVLTGSAVAESAVDPLPPLPVEDAETPFGNLLQIVDVGPKGADEWQLVSALSAAGYAGLWQDSALHPELLGELLWLATHTGLDPWLYLDSLLDADGRSALWSLLGATLNEGDRHRGEQLIALFALLRGSSLEAQHVCQNALLEVTDPVALSVLSQYATGAGPLVGEPFHPRRPLELILLAATGLLLVSALIRLVARYALQRRCEGRWSFTPRGAELLETRTFLGQRVRESRRFIPLTELRSIRVETRYAGFGLYAGLFSLAVGSYLGVAWVSDSLRTPGGSPSLLSMGLLALAAGVGLDFLLTHFFSLRSPQVRVELSAVRAGRFGLARVDQQRARLALERLAELRGFSRY